MGEISIVGVIGAGQMGAGIAQVCATAGYDVRLADRSLDLANAGLDAIAAQLDKQVAKGKLSLDQATAAKSRIETVDGLAGMATCDLVIEAASEDEATKRNIFASVSPHLSSHAILATNTSSLSITRLAAASERPDRFIGVHFMNPAPVMKLVELVRGMQTSEATFAQGQAFVQSLDKTMAIAEDSPAFIVNRVLIPMINEACYALFEGVGSVESIDAAMKLGANHPMGPFELADFIGLDICVAILRVLYDELGGVKYKPCPLLVKHVDAGWLGRKSGRGFYDYRNPTTTPASGP